MKPLRKTLGARWDRTQQRKKLLTAKPMKTCSCGPGEACSDCPPPSKKGKSR